MISVRRGSEPLALAAKRTSKLTAARNRIAHGLGSHGQTLDGYAVVKRDLYFAQHRKCAYCERDLGVASQPVEHFRPKKLAWRGSDEAKIVDPERYWWLTWTWENLYLSCVSCNSAANKANWFPLEYGPPLPLPTLAELEEGAGPAFATPAEHPLLLDPARDSPSEHIRWLPRDLSPKLSIEALRWAIVGVTARGKETLRRLGLDRDGGYEYQVHRHIRYHLVPSLSLMLNTGAHTAVWSNIAPLVRPEAAYAGATWSALDFLHRRLELSQYGLVMPPPP